jgi:hypothetical protein
MRHQRFGKYGKLFLGAGRIVSEYKMVEVSEEEVQSPGAGKGWDFWLCYFPIRKVPVGPFNS